MRTSFERFCGFDKLLGESRFYELPSESKSASPGVDRFRYRVTVEDDETVRTVEASEASVPDEMRPLIDWLTSLRRH